MSYVKGFAVQASRINMTHYIDTYVTYMDQN